MYSWQNTYSESSLRTQIEKFGFCDILQENVNAITDKRKVGKYSGLVKTEEPCDSLFLVGSWIGQKITANDVLGTVGES